ncbi:uncharacterized protein LOC110682919 [Chenopodium quinoa]|uniref:uncharacterized protein LOC110682919 n=1 Tax=Chenopodium quinoa TaxID=63459 RepID=UPI000B77270A|nr:uncharacterized protein LOC110682919 [Chenopodium quinoa]
MGFCDGWVQRILDYLSSVSFAFKINGKISSSVVLSRGLRQGDLISPYLFLIVAGAFSSMLSKAANDRLIHRARVCREDRKVSHLFFADDNLLFAKATVSECSVITNIINKYESNKSLGMKSIKRGVVAHLNRGELSSKLLSLPLIIQARTSFRLKNPKCDLLSAYGKEPLLTYWFKRKREKRGENFLINPLDLHDCLKGPQVEVRVVSSFKFRNVIGRENLRKKFLIH